MTLDMSVGEALALASDVVKGEGPEMESNDQRFAIAEQLVGSNAFTWSQAASLVGLSKQSLYRRSSESTLKRPAGRRTAGGVAGMIKNDDLPRIRYIRYHYEDRKAHHRVPDPVRDMAKVVLNNGTSPSVLAHLTGLDANTLRQVKAGRMWA